MPCDSIQLNQLEIGKMNNVLLAAALRQIGAVSVAVAGTAASFTLDGARCFIRDGKITLPAGYESIADRVKVGYSRQVVLRSAAANGWNVKETSPNVFAVVKR